jgi:hypothetical protein
MIPMHSLSSSALASASFGVPLLVALLQIGPALVLAYLGVRGVMGVLLHRPSLGRQEVAILLPVGMAGVAASFIGHMMPLDIAAASICNDPNLPDWLWYYYLCFLN